MSFLPLADSWPLTVLVGLLLAIVLVLVILWGWGLSALPTKEERAMTLPGDDLLAGDRTVRIQEAVTIKAPPERVWPYLAQIGQRRAGFYSIGWLERLLTFHIYNTFEIVDEWQNMYQGEYVFYHQNGIGSEVQDVVPGKYFTMRSDSRRPSTFQGSIAFKPPVRLEYFAWTWNFVLLDNGDGTTRFINRCDASWAPFGGWRLVVLALVLGSPSVFMVRHMMRTLKRCGEGKYHRPLIDRILGFGATRAGDPRKG
jgi:hypothetical protein